MEEESTNGFIFGTDPEHIEAYIGYITEYGLKLITALAIFFIGKWLAHLARKGVRRAMVRAHVDEVLVGFLSSLMFYALMVAVLISAIGQVGVQTTSFVAILGAAGLAIGFALQGSLANLAAGVLLILFRPFKVGDFVTAGGVSGIIEEIGILFTQMRTPDNCRIILPNSKGLGSEIINFAANPTRRVDMVFGIGYGDDIDKAKAILKELIAKDDRVLAEPAPLIAVSELGDSSVNFIVRPWVKKEDYWALFWEMQENVKKRFDAEGVSIPFPQRDVHLYTEK